MAKRTQKQRVAARAAAQNKAAGKAPTKRQAKSAAPSPSPSPSPSPTPSPSPPSPSPSKSVRAIAKERTAMSTKDRRAASKEAGVSMKDFKKGKDVRQEKGKSKCKC